MIDPEDGTLSGQDTDDRVYDVNNDSRPSANFPNDERGNEFEDNRAEVNRAAEASQASFTLEPEKGIDEGNERDSGSQNVKQPLEE